MPPHPTQRIDELAHQRVRLGVLTMLSQRDRISFTDLRDALGQSDGGLGRHLRVLEEAGYVLVEKAFENRRPRTWFSLTDAGRAAVDAETRVLADLIGVLEPGAGPAGFATPLRGDRGAPPGTDRCAERILKVAYDMSVTADGPLGPGFTAPPGFGTWAGLEAQRLTFLSHGLTGGHVRRWARAAGAGSVEILLVELRDDAAPAALLGALAEPTVYVPTLPKVCGYRFDHPVPSCVVWLARGPFLACVSVSDAADVVENRAIVLAQTQFMKLAGVPRAGDPADRSGSVRLAPRADPDRSPSGARPDRDRPGAAPAAGDQPIEARS